MIDVSIKSFKIKENIYLFFDIFHKNDNIYMILPIYTYPYKINQISLTVNDKKLKVCKTYVKNCYEPIAIYIYNFKSVTDINEIIVKYDNMIKSFKLKQFKTSLKNGVTMTTLFKDDWKLFPIYYDYYQKQEITHFYMYYNGVLNEKIRNLFDKENVTLIEWNYKYWNDRKKHKNIKYKHHAQLGQIHHAMYKYGKENWSHMGFCDFDEYLYINKNTLKNYIEKHIDTDVFGFCNRWSNTFDKNIPEQVPKRFMTSQIMDYGFNKKSKNIYRLELINLINIHSYLRENLHNTKKILNLMMFHFFNWSQKDRIIKNMRYKSITIDY